MNWAASCDEIERACGRAIPPEARIQLWYVIEQFQAHCRIGEANPKPSEVQRRIERIQSAARQLIELLASPHEGHGPNAAFDLIRGHIDLEESVHLLPPQMVALDAACSAALRDFEKRFTEGGPGRAPETAFATFIAYLAGLFQSLGGNVGYSTSPIDNKRGGPFIRFCCAAASLVEDDLAIAKVAGDLGERVANLVSKYDTVSRKGAKHQTSDGNCSPFGRKSATA